MNVNVASSFEDSLDISDKEIQKAPFLFDIGGERMELKSGDLTSTSV